MSVNPIEGVKSVVELKRVAPVERTNVKSEMHTEEKSFAQTKEEAGKQVLGTKTKELLKDGVEEINQQLKLNNRHCEFRYVEEANRVAIKVIDNETEEVVKEIPSEEALRTIQALREMTGLLVDEQL